MKDLKCNDYPKGWKAFELRLGRPKGVKQWLNAIWGLDIFIHKVPFLKVIALCHVIYWLLNYTS